MKKNSEIVSDYYLTHENILKSTYPGLKESRLLDEFCQFFNIKGSDICCFDTTPFFSLVEKGVPLEYINKESFFYRTSFYVDERVLIPRSETEILVEDAIEFSKHFSKDELLVAEVGVGSFALGLSYIMDSKHKVSFVGGDISEDALDVARMNLFRLQNVIDKKHQVSLINSDRMKEIKGEFDLILSNPPYIKEKADRDGVHSQTLKFEPHLALFLPDGEFDEWFREFFEDISKKLKPGGAFFMEGHEDSLLQLKEIAQRYFKNVKTKNDYTGRLRFLHCFK